MIQSIILNIIILVIICNVVHKFKTCYYFISTENYTEVAQYSYV